VSPTRESYSARYFALLYSPASQHIVLETLFGIEREVSESLRPGIDHQVAHSRLQWWREECERAVDGHPLHPLTRSLLDAVKSQSATAGPLLDGLSGFVDVAVWDLAGATFESRRELTAYCERWAAAMIEPLAAVGIRAIDANAVGPQARGVATASAADAEAPAAAASRSARARTADTEAHDAEPGARAVAGADAVGTGAVGTGAVVGADAVGTGAVGTGAVVGADAVETGAVGTDAARTNWRSMGAAMREVELLCDLAREAHYGRLRLPLDELDRAKVDPGTLAKPPWPDAVTEILRARHRSLRGEIARTLANVDSKYQPAIRGLLVWAALVWRLSQRAERALPDRLRPGRFDAISDAWFAWRIARKATMGRLTFRQRP
jgi:phytoene/squalene synthetase